MAYDGPFPHPVISGGTGATTLTGIVKGNSTSALTAASPVTIADGGTNATTFGTTDGIVTFNSASLVTSSSALIDSSGRYTNTTQPCAIVALANTASNATGDGTGFTILFDTVTVNVHTDYSTITGKYTISKTGRYLVCGSVGFGNIGAGHTAGIIEIATNGTSFQTGAFNYNAVKDINSNVVIPFTSIMQLSAADTVWVVASVAGSTKTVSVLGASPRLTWFNVILLA